MTEAVMTEVHFTSRTKISNHCHTLVMAFIDSIHAGESGSAGFLKILSTVLNRTDEQDDDVLAWNSAVSVLRAGLASLDFSPQEEALAANLLDTARLAIGELARRGYARVQFQKSEASNRLSLMTAQLLTALDESQVRAVLDRHLGQIGIARALVLMLCPDETDLVEQSEVFYSFGFARDLTGERFYTRRFPPPGWFPSQAGISPQDSQVPNLLLTLLPVAMPGNQRGYAVFETQNLGPLGVIVQNLESALRTSLLYADAIQGRQMAEDANQMKSRFLSMVSHELRTPLNVIVGLSEILLRQQNQPPGPALWEDLERIYFNAQHLSRLIGDVLDLVSSGSGHMRLFREPLDLTEVLRPVIATGEQMAHGKGLAWSASLPQRGLYVIGDRTRLRQAALNLVSNAVKFTARGGVTFDVAVVDDVVTVSVHDTGIGIPLEDQPKLFSEFGQSERSIQRGMSGMGLGLAITRELIEQQGGKIGVVSTGEEGSGSTFFFTLPTTVPHDLQDPTGPQDDSILPGEAPTRRGPAPRVLFLTNRADSAEPLAAQLEAKGYALEVCAYQDNPEWLFQLLDSPPGAVVIDEDLAANRGWDIFAVLKRNDATALLPVLVCRMDAERGDAVIELDYQLKPLTPGHIARALNIHNLNAAPGSDGNGAQNPSEAPVTVLVVDDDAAIRFTHTRLVQQQLPNSRVLQAENGREAQEIIRHTRPDLVLLDLLMPEVDGFAVLESLRGQESTCDVPVIILTAKTITEEDIAQLNRGVAAILTKGLFRGSEIGEHIEQVLKRAPGLGTASQRLVRRAIAYIHANYAESLTRDQIAEYVSVTPDHLADCFHQEMGITPVAYLYRYRIARARLLLEEGGRNITEVALAVGFSDSAHFSRVFQREVGTSPRAYLRSRG
jgi:signal transduction histidine kinase/AraC-like DNA-binding protein